MKRALWIIRHEMTPDKKYDLDQVLLVMWSVSILLLLVEQADAAAAVLTTELLAQLWKHRQDKPLLQSVSRRVLTGRVHVFPDGTTEHEFQFVHGGAAGLAVQLAV